LIVLPHRDIFRDDSVEREVAEVARAVSVSEDGGSGGDDGGADLVDLVASIMREAEEGEAKVD